MEGPLVTNDLILLALFVQPKYRKHHVPMLLHKSDRQSLRLGLLILLDLLQINKNHITYLEAVSTMVFQIQRMVYLPYDADMSQIRSVNLLYSQTPV